MILNAFFLAFRQIKRNILRSILTMLGIIIGVSAVIVMINLGNGATQMITSQISSLGSNVIMVFPSRALSTTGAAKRRDFSIDEVALLKSLTTKYIDYVAPIVQGSVLLQYRQKNTQTVAAGIDSEYFGVTGWKIKEGRNFEDKEYKAGVNVCILGESAKKNLFDDQSPLGAKIKIAKIMCEVIGVLESKGQGAMGNDQDDTILLPLRAFKRGVSKKNSINFINRIMLSSKSGADSELAVKEVKNMMYVLRPTQSGASDAFEIFDTKELIKTVSQTTATLTLFLGAVAGVSLLVGGIGIMNIMLVSVTERTKEIGTRLAIGALQHEVLLQFLIESVVLSTIGGSIGIVLAIFGTMGLSAVMNLPFVFDIFTAVIAFLFSAFIGIAFGYLPAKRASRLNPIDALRHE